MNPWTIIGWGILVIVVAIELALALFVWDTRLEPAIATWAVHRRTRNIAPAPGQVWMRGDGHVTITGVIDDKLIWATNRLLPDSSGATWSETPDEWRARVKRQRMWLLTERCPFWARHLGLERKP